MNASLRSRRNAAPLPTVRGIRNFVFVSLRRAGASIRRARRTRRNATNPAGRKLCPIYPIPRGQVPYRATEACLYARIIIEEPLWRCFMDNAAIAHELLRQARELADGGENLYRVRAYRRAAAELFG